MLTLVLPCIFLRLTLASDMHGVESDGGGALSAASQMALGTRVAVRAHAFAAATHHSTGKRVVTTADVALQTDIAPSGYTAPAPVIEFDESGSIIVHRKCF